MKSLFLAAILIFIGSLCFAAENTGEQDALGCGNAIVKVYFNSDAPEHPYFSLNIVAKGGSTHHSAYAARNEFFLIRCQKNAEGKDFIVFNHICGGSGCIESNWGIIDATKLKVLLAPEAEAKGNHVKATKILGRKVEPFSCKSFSRTSSALNAKQPNGEYCYSFHINEIFTQSLATNAVIKRVQTDKLYSSWTTIECLSFMTTEEPSHFDVAIHEKHGGACPGDPLTSPVVDRFRVHRQNGKIDWYEVTEGEYVPYENVKKFRLKK